MVKPRHPDLGFRVRFCVSLHPEIFFALQVFEDDTSRVHPEWKKRAKRSFDSSARSMAIPAGLWPAIADGVHLSPTREISTILAAFQRISLRTLQERILVGAFHDGEVVRKLIDQEVALSDVPSKLPKAKREWLAYVGLFPLDKRSAEAAALDLLIRRPGEFRRTILRTLSSFWSANFKETWRTLEPMLDSSARQKEALFRSSSFREFIRHSLLPIEIDEEKRKVLALRGGAVLSMDEIDRWTFSPSVFNDKRLWTVHATRKGVAPWAPYFEPEIQLPGGQGTFGRKDLEGPPADIALILRALGDPTRFALVTALGREPRTSAELAGLLSVSKPTISHHIHLLRSAGLIHETGHGSSVLISLQRAVFERISEMAVAHIFETRGPLRLIKSRSS